MPIKISYQEKQYHGCACYAIFIDLNFSLQKIIRKKGPKDVYFRKVGLKIWILICCLGNRI